MNELYRCKDSYGIEVVEATAYDEAVKERNQYQSALIVHGESIATLEAEILDYRQRLQDICDAHTDGPADLRHMAAKALGKYPHRFAHNPVANEKP